MQNVKTPNLQKIRHVQKNDLKNKENVTKKKCFVKKEVQVWVCRNCGHKHVGKSAPKECPVCAHPQAYFEIESKNY